jgi:hypothetical protein
VPRLVALDDHAVAHRDAGDRPEEDGQRHNALLTTRVIAG